MWFCPLQCGPTVSLYRSTLCLSNSLVCLWLYLANNSIACTLVSPLKALTGNKKWPVEMTYHPLLRFIIRIIFIYSNPVSFPFTMFPYHPQMHFLCPLHLPLLDSPLPPPIHSLSIKSTLYFHPRGSHVPPPDHSSLSSLPESMDLFGYYFLND